MNDKDIINISQNDLLSKQEIETEKPTLYRVILINDDFTPMEFVVDVLMSIFHMDKHNATKTMLSVHTKGKGICGLYTYEIAETKVAQVKKMARDNQYPLLCSLEKE